MDLRDADLRRAFLEATRLVNCDLSGADLTGACLRKSTLRFTRFLGADLTSARIDGADVKRADFLRSAARRRIVSRSDADPRPLPGRFAGGSEPLGGKFGGGGSPRRGPHRRDFSRATLQGADLRRTVLKGANLSGAYILQETGLSGAIYDKATRWPEDFRADERGALLSQPFALRE